MVTTEMTEMLPLGVGVKEAGRLLGIGRTTAWRLVRSGELRTVRICRRVIVPMTEVTRLLGQTPDA